MPRLPFRNVEDLPAEHQDLLARNINLYRELVHSPGILRAFSGLGGYIRHRSKLDPRLRELAILQVGWLARAPYEWSHHIKIGMEFGVTEDDVHALIDDSAGKPNQLDGLTRAVLRGARQITSEGELRDATFAELRASLDEECLVDLIVTIAFYNGVVRILASLQIDVEESYQPYLAKFPLPA